MPVKKTNFEMIRALTEEELAEFLERIYCAGVEDGLKASACSEDDDAQPIEALNFSADWMRKESLYDSVVEPPQEILLS